MKECKIKEKVLNDFVDGIISAKDLKVVEEHLKTCAACRDVVKTLRETVKLLVSRGSFKAEPPSPERVWDALSARIKAKENSKRLFFKPYIVGLLSGSIAALVLFFIVLPANRPERNEGAVSLVAGQIVAALISGGSSAQQYVDTDSILISGGRMLEGKQLEEYFQSMKKNVRALTIIVADSPVELFNKERSLFKCSKEYVDLRSMQLEESLVCVDVLKRSDLVYVSVFIEGDGNFTFAILRKAGSWKIKYFIEEA